MIPLSAEVIERLSTFLWPMLRISAMLLTAPPFSGNAITVRVRVLVALVLTWLVYPLHQWPVIDPASAEGVVEIFNQILIGASMGLTLQIVVAALAVAGQTIAATMGLSMASMVDPNVGSVPTLSQFLILCSTLIFVGLGGPGLLLGLVAESFHTLPIGTSILTQDVYGRMLRWSSMMFVGALLLSLPVVATLLFVNIGLGVITRAAPSLNIFAVGFPAMIVAGFLVLILSMDVLGGRIEWLWQQSFMALRTLLGVPGG